MIITLQRERTRFLKFMLVGVVGAVVDFGVFNLLVNLVHVFPVPASMVSFSCAIVSNFIWNRYWTYPDSRGKPVQHQVFQFIMVSLAGLAIRTGFFAFLEPRLRVAFSRFSFPAPLTPTFLGHNIGLAIAILVVMLWNFFANRYWTYSDIQA